VVAAARRAAAALPMCIRGASAAKDGRPPASATTSPSSSTIGAAGGDVGQLGIGVGDVALAARC